MKKIFAKLGAFLVGLGALIGGILYLFSMIKVVPKTPEIDVKKEEEKIDKKAEQAKEQVDKETKADKENIKNAGNKEILDSLDPITKKKIEDIKGNVITDIMEEVMKRG